VLLPGSAVIGKSVCHGRGDTGVECEAAMQGKESKWCSAGEDMAESVSIRDDMTSADAGLTLTRLESRRRASRSGPSGNDRRRRSSFDPLDLGLVEVLADVLSGIGGPCLWSNMATECYGTRDGKISAWWYARTGR